MKKTIFLMGGLGNILYQLNFANQLVAKGYQVNLNSFLITKNVFFKIINWKTHGIQENQINLFNFYNLKISNNFSFIILIYLFKFNILKTIFKFNFFGHNMPNDTQINNTHYFLGYFQKTKVISPKIKEAFNNRFTDKIDPLLEAKLLSEETAVIHFRGGDKIKNEIYKSRFDNIFISNNFDSYIIVTDDIRNSKKYFNKFNHNIIYISSDSLLMDFKIIQLAKFKFLSRSSFSWWAAELSSFKSEIFQPTPFYTHVDWEPFSNIKRDYYDS